MTELEVRHLEAEQALLLVFLDLCSHRSPSCLPQDYHVSRMLLVLIDPTCWSPAPKANDNFAKTTFCSEIAEEKNARAFGVRCTGWLGDVLLNDFFPAKL
jgi:hypothetical protein